MKQETSWDGQAALLGRLGQQPAAQSPHNALGVIWVARGLVGVVLAWCAKTALWLTGLAFVLGWFFGGSALWSAWAILATYGDILRAVLRAVVPVWMKQTGMAEFTLLVLIWGVAGWLFMLVGASVCRTLRPVVAFLFKRWWVVEYWWRSELSYEFREYFFFVGMVNAGTILVLAFFELTKIGVHPVLWWVSFAAWVFVVFVTAVWGTMAAWTDVQKLRSLLFVARYRERQTALKHAGI